MTDLKTCREDFDHWFSTTRPETLDFSVPSTLREFAYQSWKDATIKANARDAVVSDEDVERACNAYNEHQLLHDGFAVSMAMRAALESFAASLPVAKQLPPMITLHEAPDSIEDVYPLEAFARGWNACREALLAQGRDGVRDGLTAQTFGGWCNTLTHAYMYITEREHGNAQRGIEMVLNDLREWQRKLNAAPFGLYPSS